MPKGSSGAVAFQSQPPFSTDRVDRDTGCEEDTWVIFAVRVALPGSSFRALVSRVRAPAKSLAAIFSSA